MNFKKNGERERTNGKHFLQPVKAVRIETEYQGTSEISDGFYIEMCECHPQSRVTKYVEIHNGEYFASNDIHNFVIH